MKIGGGGEDFLQKVLSSPSKPPPPLPKTFVLIESLFSGFPYREKSGGKPSRCGKIQYFIQLW